MQISNPAISQYLSSSVIRSQQADRFPVKAVTIEGQLIDDNKKQSEANKTQDSGLQNSGLQDSGLADPEQSKDGTQAQLIAPSIAPQIPQKITSDSAGDSLLIQKKLSDNPAVLTQNDSSVTKQNFPYSNRRSFEGLSGGSLVIQKYLNNESPALAQPDSPQRNIDFFI